MSHNYVSVQRRILDVYQLQCALCDYNTFFFFQFSFQTDPSEGEKEVTIIEKGGYFGGKCFSLWNRVISVTCTTLWCTAKDDLNLHWAGAGRRLWVHPRRKVVMDSQKGNERLAWYGKLLPRWLADCHHWYSLVEALCLTRGMKRIEQVKQGCFRAVLAYVWRSCASLLEEGWYYVRSVRRLMVDGGLIGVWEGWWLMEDW